MCRLLIVILGALPASLLASFAVGVAGSGARSLASAEPSGALFMAWGILGIAGTAGLWLAVIEGPAIEGPFPRIAAVLIGCGLAADAVLLGVPLFHGALSARFLRGPEDIIYWGLTVPPFVVGAVYVGRIVFHKLPAGVGCTAV
jgi:hypothetical protein